MRARILPAHAPWSRGTGPAGGTGLPPRPDGALIWAHALTLDHANAMMQVAERLSAFRSRPLSLLLTTPPDVPVRPDPGARVLHRPVPDDVAVSAEAFVDHWQPDLCLWAAGELRPVLIACADKRGIPLFLVDADAAHLPRPGWRWLPDAQRGALARFSMILARSDAAARHIQRMGVREDNIAISGILQEGALALPHDEGMREKMAECLRGRPIWLAAMVQPGELADVLQAHRTVTRLAHRLFLVLVPDDPAHADRFAQVLGDGGWRYSVWSAGDMPGETTQILLADTRGDMGLWYRLATITLMGSSLAKGQHGRDPNEPAAHGSAIMYGPNVGRYLPSYTRYADAGAARMIEDADSLSAALAQLIAPDQSAEMAHAAWDVASASAQVTDQIIDLVQDTLDVLEAQ